MKKLVLTIAISSSILFASNGEQLTIDNGCMECHNIMGKKLAPAFMGTAKKNIKFYGDEAKLHIINGIKNGSKGKYRNFADSEMPAYEYISPEDIDIIATWILSEYQKNKKLYPNGRTTN